MKALKLPNESAAMQTRKRQRGASVVEMAIVLPLLIAILLGIIDVGTAIYDYSMLNHGVRVGARWGTIPTNNTTGTHWSCPGGSPPTPNPCTVTNQTLSGLLISYKPTSSPVTTAGNHPSDANILQVTTTYTFKGVFTGGFLSLPLSATANMSYE